MNNLQNGEILRRISDSSKWRFLHYKPIQIFSRTSEDKNFIHVKEWNENRQEWKNWDIEGGHQEFPTGEFERYN